MIDTEFETPEPSGPDESELVEEELIDDTDDDFDNYSFEYSAVDDRYADSGIPKWSAFA